MNQEPDTSSPLVILKRGRLGQASPMQRNIGPPLRVMGLQGRFGKIQMFPSDRPPIFFSQRGTETALKEADSDPTEALQRGVFRSV